VLERIRLFEAYGLPHSPCMDSQSRVPVRHCRIHRSPNAAQAIGYSNLSTICLPSVDANRCCVSFMKREGQRGRKMGMQKHGRESAPGRARLCLTSHRLGLMVSGYLDRDRIPRPRAVFRPLGDPMDCL
jgi:hypothetical protein